jgi:2-oxoglutarate dehydrogenase E2 component (dihydrolipoamide succinyltransferase)
MATEVIMPQMGESIAEGTVIKWYKQVGETVERDEPLFEISTDKVDTEIPSPVTGVLTEIKVNEGETVPINTVVAVIGGEGEVAAPEADVGEVEEEAPAEPAEVEAEAVTTEAVDEEIPIIVEPEEPVAPGTDRERGIRSSPLVRRIAREHGVDLARVPGSGRGGRITKDDVLGFVEKGAPVAVPAAPAPVAAPPEEAPVVAPATVSVAAAAGTREERVKMSVMRTSIAKHMVASRRTSAHVATVFEADVSGIVKLREGHKERRGAQGEVCRGGRNQADVHAFFHSRRHRRPQGFPGPQRFDRGR